MESLNLASLDFDRINFDLKQYFKSQEKWKDYNFESDALATTLFIDILSALTYKQNVYLNAGLNETFLSTANTRDAVVRKAKQMNYRIASRNAAMAKVRLTFQPSNYPAYILIPKFTKFTATGESGTFDFITKQTYYCYPDEDNNYIVDIDLWQGQVLEYTWNVANDQKIFTIPNKNVDTKKMLMNIKFSTSDLNWTEFTESKNIINNTGNSNVYFIQEGKDEYFQFYFGDGIVGKVVPNGAIINLKYIITDGLEGNNIETFNIADTLEYQPSDITTLRASEGGNDIESIESIKRYAPLVRNAQNRAVVVDDFEALIKENFPQIGSISTWGGESNNPPYYGKVCIAALTTSSYALSDTLKEQITNLFDDNNIVGSKQLKWFDPVMLNLNLNLDVYYDNKTSLSTTDLEAIIIYGVAYFNNAMREFNYTFEPSVFTTYIKSLNPAIKDIVLSIKLEYNFNDYSSSNYSLSYQNPIEAGTVTTNKYYNADNNIAYLKDNGSGVINEYINQNGIEIISRGNIGTIDYVSGDININNIAVHALLNDTKFRIIANSLNTRIISKQGVLLNIPYDKTQIKLHA